MFLKDTTISISVTMAILYTIVALFAGSSYIETELSKGQSFLVYCFIQSLTFAAGIYVMLQGVQMFIAEIGVAFIGISDKLVPNAKPAITCPMLFPYAPNAIIIGFIPSFIAALLMMFITPMLGLAIIIPNLAVHFFTGATAGIYGNATGGIRGAIVGSIVNGMLVSLLPAVLVKFLPSLASTGTTFGDVDISAVGIILSSILNLIK